MTDTVASAVARYVELHGAYNWEMHELLADLARINVATVLEIGCHRGDSLRIWRAMWPGAMLIGIEPTDEIEHAVRELDVHWVKGRSQEGATHDFVCDLLGDRSISGRFPVDFLYIDGDHTYDAVKRDWELYEPLVRPGGIVVLHDAVITWNPTVDVYRLYDEIRPGRRTKLIYAGGDPADPYGGSTGAAIVFKP